MLKDHTQIDIKTADKEDNDLYDRYVGRVDRYEIAKLAPEIDQHEGRLGI